MLSEIDQTTVRTRNGTHSLLDSVGFVSGVSGGSVTAAYYGLKKRAALADFREKFLIRNAEAGLRHQRRSASASSRRSAAASTTSQTFSRWLDENLFDGATFADFRKTPGPRVWINASDIYNRTPFIYGEATFIALCSNLATYPIADAVAASAAVPIVFTPQVIKTYTGGCTDKPPDWLEQGAQQSQRRADAQGFRGRALQLSRRRDQIRQAARRRPGRQFRPVRLHHLAAVGADAARAAVAASRRCGCGARS